MANLNENDEVYRKQQINQNTFQGQLIQNHQQENNYNLNNPVIKISKKFEKFDKFLKSKRNKKVTSSKVLQTVDIQDNSGSFVNISEKSKNFENDNKNNKIIQNNLQKSHQLKVSKNKNFTQILRRSSFRNAQSLQKTNINKNQPQIEPCYSNISNIMSKDKKLLKKKLIILHKYSFLKGNSLFKTGKSFEKQRSLQKKQSNPLMPVNIQKKSDILSKQNEISNKNNQNLNNTNYIFNILQKFHKECYINAKQQQPRISFFQKLKNEKELKNQSQKYLYKSSNKKINLNNISSQKLKLQFQSNIQAFQKTCHGLLAVGFSKEQNERDKEYKNYHTMSKNYNFKNGLNRNTKSLFVMPVHSISDQQKGALVVNIKIDAQADNNVISNLNISDSQKILLTPKGKNPFKSHNQSLKKQLKSLRKMKLQKQQRLIQRKIKISMNKNRNSLDPKRSISIFNYPTVMSQKQ